MNENNRPIHYVETLLGDIAHLFSMGDDTVKYVVKFNNYRNRTKEIVNEYIVGKLAELLSLPVLPMQVIYVSKEEINSLPRKIGKKIQTAGNHISFPFIDHCQPFTNVSDSIQKDELMNRSSLAGMIVFDIWVNNSDRSRTNLLLQPISSGYHFHMIDHGRCFPEGYNWTVESLMQNIQFRTNMPIYKWATSLLNHEDELRIFMHQILALEKKDIEDIFLSIPGDWYITDEEKEQLLLFLLRQRIALPHIIDAYINQYSHLIRK